jgi:hypothetical protein
MNECIIFHSTILLLHSFAEGKSDKEILDQLLTNSRYDKRLLPPVDGKVFVYNLNKFLLCHPSLSHEFYCETSIRALFSNGKLLPPSN